MIFASTLRGQEPVALAGDLQAIMDAGVLKVAMLEQDFPPFLITEEEGHLSGFDIKMAQRIGLVLGVRLEYVREARNAAGVVQLVQEGKADIGMSNIKNTLDWGAEVLFTDPYTRFPQTLLIDRMKSVKLEKQFQENQGEGDEMLINIGDDALAHPTARSHQHMLNQPGVVLGVVEGSPYVWYAHQLYPKAQIQVFPNFAPIIEAMGKGTLLGALAYKSEILEFHLTHPSDAIFKRTMVLENIQEESVIAVSLDKPYLRYYINLLIGKLQADGTLQRWHKDYFNYESIIARGITGTTAPVAELE